MPGKFTLEVMAGPIKGQSFTFEDHDTLFFGRGDDCQAKLSGNDTTASRHHFLLEANPPDARIQDIGSRNGTYINGTKTGGRPAHMTPEEARNLEYPTVDLKDGDEIKVGDTVFKVRVDIPAVCCQCADVIPDKYQKMCEWHGVYVCPDCREQVEREGVNTVTVEVVCNKCGKDVSAEVGKGRDGDYTCQVCQAKAEADPGDFLRELVSQHQEQGVPGSGSIDDYELGKELGRGGMGAVYLASRKSDGKTLAIKVMLAKIAVNDEARKGFKREVDSTRVLSHTNIVALYDFNYSGNMFFFALEYCPGGSLWDLLTNRRAVLSLKEAGPLMLQSLDGLAYAHEQKLVHRDLKPQNILLSAVEGGIAKVSDFGLAKSFDKAGLSGYTKTGDCAGTFPFMPREQLTNFKYVKPVSDVWSMGATFYFLITAEFPRAIVAGQSPAEAVMSGQIVPIQMRDPTIPKAIAEVIDRSLVSNAKDRYQTAAEFRDALKNVL